MVSENINNHSDEKDVELLKNQTYEVYVVEDVEEEFMDMKDILQGYIFNNKTLNLKIFSNEKDTINALNNGNHDVAVIFLDIRMVDVNEAGFEVIRHLRNKQKNNITQIIVQTGQAGDTIKDPDEIAREFEINDFIEKGIQSGYMRIRTALTTSLRMYELLKKLSNTNKNLEVINSSLLKFFNLTKNKDLHTIEEKRVLVQILFDQINKNIHKGKKLLSSEAYERLISNECNNIVYLHTIISRALNSSKVDVINEKDLVRAEKEPLIMWQKEEEWLKKLHRALCGEKIGDMQHSAKFIDPTTPYEVFREHHLGINSHMHINWTADLGSLLYLYFALLDKNTLYIADNGIWDIIHNELVLHFLFKGDLLNPRSLISTKNENIKKTAKPKDDVPQDPNFIIEFTIEDRWVGESKNKEIIDEIINNLEE